MNQFATTAQLFQYLNQATPSASEEALGQVVLDRAASILEGALYPVAFADWPATATARWVESAGGAYIKLPPHQQGTVTVLTYGSTVVDTAAYFETEQGNIRLTPSVGYNWPWCRSVPSGWGWVMGMFQVSAKWGYGPPPESMTELCIEIAVTIRKNRDSGMFQQVLGADDGASLRYVGGLNSTQRAMIQNIKSKYQGLVF